MTTDNTGKTGFTKLAANEAIVKVMVYIMYTAIVGSGVYFATALHQVKATIAQHHGQGWAELKNVIQTSQIQEQVSGAKTELEHLLAKREAEIRQLSRRIRALEHWTKQGDVIMSALDKRQFKGHALFTDDGSGERLCTVNYAHPGGRVFKVNDTVSIINSDSHREETTQCTVSATVYDMEQPTVLFTLNKATAKRIGFSKELGRITIFANMAELEEDRRWKSLADYGRSPYFNEVEYSNPFVNLPSPAAGPTQ